MNSISQKTQLPVVVPHVFEPDYYQHIRDTEEVHWWAVGMRDIMAAWLDPALAGAGPLRVLDVGCGTGLVVNWLRRDSLMGEPLGVDLSAHALAFGRQCGATALGLATANGLPFPANDFDLVVCLDTLQHVSPEGADRETLLEFARVLKPGGRLYLRTNSVLGHAPLRGADPNLYRRYQRQELVEMLKKAGLETQRSSYVNSLMSAWAMLKEYLAASRQTAPIGPGLSIRLPRFAVVNKMLRGLMMMEATLIGPLGWQLPFGHSIVILACKPQEKPVSS